MTAPSDAFRIRSYKLRRGRVTAAQAEALGRLWPVYGVGPLPLPSAASEPSVPSTPPPGPNDAATLPPDLGLLADPARLFGRVAPLVVEIGFGMGEATAALAARQPDVDVLAVDLHTPGVGSLLRRLDALMAPPVRVVMADAVDVLQALPPGSVSLVRLFFPDPWPKARHAKRRLVGPAFLDLLASRLVAAPADPELASQPHPRPELPRPELPLPGLPLPGLHVATDWPDYAEHVRAAVAESPHFRLHSPPPDRERTRFEELGAAAGRPAQDLYAVRVGGR